MITRASQISAKLLSWVDYRTVVVSTIQNLKRVLNCVRDPVSTNGKFDSRRIELFCASAPGSPNWLVGKEMYYGGLQTNVRRNKVSPNDPRTTEEIRQGGMIGGDRMYHHGYAEYYATFLNSFLHKSPEITLVEIGILKGTGLAVWCDLFPGSRIIGLDIDLGHFKDNLNKLRRCKAFQSSWPELYEFDQFLDNRDKVQKLLRGSLIDICIDDGFHSVESIMKTFRSIFPFLSAEFVYFIEDNWTVSAVLADEFSELKVWSYGKLTVVTRS
jgi:hypothetical protein